MSPELQAIVEHVVEYCSQQAEQFISAIMDTSAGSLSKADIDTLGRWVQGLCGEDGLMLRQARLRLRPMVEDTIRSHVSRQAASNGLISTPFTGYSRPSARSGDTTARASPLLGLPAVTCLGPAEALPPGLSMLSMVSECQSVRQFAYQSAQTLALLLLAVSNPVVPQVMGNRACAVAPAADFHPLLKGAVGRLVGIPQLRLSPPKSKTSRGAVKEPGSDLAPAQAVTAHVVDRIWYGSHVTWHHRALCSVNELIQL